MTPYKRLRLILGDQLNAGHSWFRDHDPDTLYVIAELRQETDYVLHHIQKICAFFAAMERFADALQKAGHQVCYLTLDDTLNYKDLPHLLQDLQQQTGAQVIEYQQPDEHRLASQLACMSWPSSVMMQRVDTEHFLLDLERLDDYFVPGKHQRMESFYRKMRKATGFLMQDNEPLGGQWNFDSQNRQSLKQKDIDELPEPLCFANDVRDILSRIQRHQVKFFGVAHQQLLWPVTRQQALTLLDYFCEKLLPHFGQFQDAMTCNSRHQWSLYHSRLSFALNTKMISPRQVIERAIEAYQRSNGDIDIAQIEGFVRQILGWREYVRGMYWVNGESYGQRNHLKADKPLPDWFWSGDTRMQCMRSVITQSLEYAYAHHIQRLMVVGNFSLLAGLDPDQVDGWYLGIYADAIEWVEQPNTRGMALFADGGWIATKPYAASGNYINKMSDYCRSCSYDVKAKAAENACPFNALYWNFLNKHDDVFALNPRMAFPYKNWQKQSPEQQNALLKSARQRLGDLNNI